MGSLYTHSDLDGIVSGALMLNLMESEWHRRYDEVRITDYWDIDEPDNICYWKKNSINRENLSRNDTVLDLPQPGRRILFWADHHEDNEHPNGSAKYKLYDPKAPSCAGLIFRHYAGLYPKLQELYGDLVEITDRVDSANYRSIDEYDDLSIPGIRLDLSLDGTKKRLRRLGVKEVERKTEIKRSYLPSLVRGIGRTCDWKGLTEHPDVVDRARWVKNQQIAYEEAAKKLRVRHGPVIIERIDQRKKRLPGMFSKYSAFRQFPDTEVMVGFYLRRSYSRHIKYSISIVAKKNTFIENHNTVNLGQFMKDNTANGGGHSGIGVASFDVVQESDAVEAERVFSLLLGRLEK